MTDSLWILMKRIMYSNIYYMFISTAEINIVLSFRIYERKFL